MLANDYDSMFLEHKMNIFSLKNSKFWPKSLKKLTFFKILTIKDQHFDKVDLKKQTFGQILIFKKIVFDFKIVFLLILTWKLKHFYFKTKILTQTLIQLTSIKILT